MEKNRNGKFERISKSHPKLWIIAMEVRLSKFDGIKYSILTFRCRMTDYTKYELDVLNKNYPCVSFIREMIKTSFSSQYFTLKRILIFFFI